MKGDYCDRPGVTLSTSMIVYTAEHLYCIRDSRPTNLNQYAWKSACTAAGVATRQRTQRGCRGGTRKQRAIQVIVRGRLMIPAMSLDQLNRGRHLKTIALRTTMPNLKVILQNTRSICNKVSVVTETIIDAGADVSFLTETWLRSDHQQIVNDLTLPGFELKQLNRLGKRGGGLCVLYRNALRP